MSFTLKKPVFPQGIALALPLASKGAPKRCLRDAQSVALLSSAAKKHTGGELAMPHAHTPCPPTSINPTVLCSGGQEISVL